ncbi:hypothetical protein PtB15_4B75 [Puccinia triticina]|nr:hypothetical protein PtB15_4B75 [Puccinia triticina]
MSDNSSTSGTENDQDFYNSESNFDSHHKTSSDDDSDQDFYASESNSNSHHETSSDDDSCSHNPLNSRASSIDPNDSNEQTYQSSESDTSDETTSDSSSDEEFSASDKEEILTSDYSETSGSDDPSYTSPSDTDSDSSETDPSFAINNHQRELIEKLILTGHRGPKILNILLDEHGIKISPQDLTRKQKEWGLRLCDLKQRPPPAPLPPKVRASLISSHSKGMNLVKIRARLVNETGVDVVVRTIKRYLRQLNLKILRNDVADGRVTMDEVFLAVWDAQDSRLQEDAGHQRMRIILMREYDIQIPHSIPKLSSSRFAGPTKNKHFPSPWHRPDPVSLLITPNHNSLVPVKTIASHTLVADSSACPPCYHQP